MTGIVSCTAKVYNILLYTLVVYNKELLLNFIIVKQNFAYSFKGTM